MKTIKPLPLVLCLILTAIIVAKVMAAESGGSGPYEYITIRWDGRENTHIVRPGGQVEFIGLELQKLPKPKAVDERAFYMNLAMNGLTKDGFEFAGMSNDEIIMKRPLGR